MNPIVGIDLGTTNSSIAAKIGDVFQIIPNSRGGRYTPSVVSFDGNGSMLYGETARNQAALRPEQTLRAFKRLMGTDWHINGPAGRFGPTEAAQVLFEKLRQDAHEYLGKPVREAVVTVPANCTDAARKATLAAADKAGLRVLRLLNEPTSAALTCADRLESNGILMVYDMGGGTFDVTILERSGDEYRVLATAGDARLGGNDFDAAIFEYAARHIQERYGIDMKGDPGLRWQLDLAAEQAKINLTEHEKTSIVLPFISAQGASGHVQCEIERPDFEALINPLVERSLVLCGQVLRESGLSSDRLGALVLSGGSSRIPLIRRGLQKILPAPRMFGLNPDEAVALGAAVFGNMIREGKANFLRDVNAWPIGIEVDDGTSLVMIPRNQSLPCEAKRVFTTIEDGQDEVEVHILQGEAALASANVSLGRFVMSGILGAPRGVPRIEVTMSIDVDGRLTVDAVDVNGDAKKRLTIDVTYSFDPSGAAKTLGRKAGIEAVGNVSLSARIEERLSEGNELPHELEEALRTVARRLKVTSPVSGDYRNLSVLGEKLLSESMYH